MVLVQVGTVVVLTTGHTTTTGMLASLSDTTVTGGDVTAAGRECQMLRRDVEDARVYTHCLRVLVSLVGMAAVV